MYNLHLKNFKFRSITHAVFWIIFGSANLCLAQTSNNTIDLARECQCDETCTSDAKLTFKLLDPPRLNGRDVQFQLESFGATLPENSNEVRLNSLISNPNRGNDFLTLPAPNFTPALPNGGNPFQGEVLNPNTILIPDDISIFGGNNIEDVIDRDFIDGVLRPPGSKKNIFNPKQQGCPTCSPTPTAPDKDDILPASTQPHPDRVKDLCKNYVQESTGGTSLSCSTKVADLCRYLSDCSLNEILEKLNSEFTAESYRKKVNAYDDACLSKEISHPEIDIDIVNQRSGILRINPVVAETNSVCKAISEELKSSENIFCSGVILSKNRIATAQHCFFDERKKKIRATKICLDIGAVEYRSLGSPNKAIALKSMLDSDTRMKKLQTSEDHVILTTMSNITDGKGLELTATPYSKPDIYAPSLIASYHQLVLPNATKATPHPWWSKKVRASNHSCAPVRVSDKCIITKCQTIAGFSGAPLWSIVNAPDNKTQTVLTGLQVQGGIDNISSCRFGANEKIRKINGGNLAVRLDPDLIKQLQQRDGP